MAAGEVTGYTIGIGVTSGNYVGLIPVTPGTATSEQLASLGLTPGTKYFIAIRAESAGGSSAWSAEVQYTPPLPIPNAPSNFVLA
jgi:hypothetical protein